MSSSPQHPTKPPSLPKPSAPTQPGSTTGPFGAKKSNMVVGVDIGHDAIRMVRLQHLPGGKFSFEGCRAVALKPGLDPSSAQFTSTLKDALKYFCGPARDTTIWTTLKLDRVRVQHLQIPRVSSSRLPGAVFWALKREEPFQENETVVDFEVEEENAPATEGPLQVTGFLAPRENLDALTRAFAQAGYPVTGIAPPLYSLRNLFRTGLMQAPAAPAAFSQIGLESSRVSILIGGRSVFTRSIPIGLQSFTEALIVELKPPPTPIQASSLIQNFGAESKEKIWTEQAVFEALRPALERLAVQIERTLEYYQTTYKIQRVEKVYLAGTIAARNRVTEFLDSHLTAELIVMDAFSSPHLQATTALPTDREERIDFTQAFGLALSASGRTPNLARTYQDRQKERQAKQVKAGIFSLFIILAVACSAFYGWQLLQVRGLQAERDSLNRSLEATGPRLNEATILATMAEIRGRHTDLKTVARRYEGVALFTEIAGLTPDYIRLLHLSGQFGAPGNTSGDAQRKNLRMEGIVNGERASLETFLTVYVARLDQSPLIRDVEVEKTELIETADGLRLTFALNMDTGEKPTEAKPK